MDTLKTVAALVKPRADVEAYKITITPDMAKEILAQHHAGNRKPSLASVEAYAHDIRAGRWLMNGAAVIFDRNGKLIDGQHRMAAIAMAGVPLDVIAIVGVSNEAQDTMDTGRKRTFADQINIHTSGDKLGTKVVAALRGLYLIGQAGTGGKLGGVRLSNAQLRELYLRHPGIVDSVKLVNEAAPDGSKVTARPGTVAALHYVATTMLKGQKARANKFVSTLRTGLPDPDYRAGPENDPAHAVGKAFRNRPSENDALKLLLRAWSLYVSGEAAPTKGFTWSKAKPLPTDPVANGDGRITPADIIGDNAAEAMQALGSAPEELFPAPEPKAPPKGKVVGQAKSVLTDPGYKPANEAEAEAKRKATAPKAKRPARKAKADLADGGPLTGADGKVIGDTGEADTGRTHEQATGDAGSLTLGS